MKFNKIGFIGLGLIGGSIAKAIKEKFPQTQMIALASRQETIDLAYADGIIENEQLAPIADFAECDLIFLCSPVKINVEYLNELKQIISPECIITDVGSVKGNITAAVEKLGLSAQFIGGHPMAGAEVIGYANSKARLLENAYYILTSTPELPAENLEQFDSFITALGSLTMRLAPEQHDFAVACISHLPHIISAALVNFVKGADDETELMKTIAAGGFRDITRISSSSPVMWQNICATNRESILRAAKLYLQSLESFITAVGTKDDDRTIDLFSSAKDYRDSLPIKSGGSLLPKVYQFYIDLADEAGAIAIIATILAANSISIKNIGIVNNREFEQGVLRIEVYDQESMDKAIELLEARFPVYS